MHAALLLALLAPGVWAAPTPAPVAISVPLHAAASPRHLHAEAAVRAAFRRDEALRARVKYASALLGDGERDVLRRDLAAAGHSRRDGTERMPLTSYMYDTAYLATISVGTPPQDIQIIPDTGSSDLWVFSDLCTTCGEHPVFHSKKSSTFTFSGGWRNQSYGSGGASEQLGKDTVSLGGWTVKEQDIALFASGDVADVLRAPIGGIMGLAWRYLAAEHTTPWWQKAGPNWPEPVFAFHFGGRGPAGNLSAHDTTGVVPTRADAGSLTFGGLDKALYTGDVHYVNSTHDWWRITLDALSVGGRAVNVTNVWGDLPSMAVDTGTSGIFLPRQFCEEILELIPGASASGDDYFLPCDTQVTLELTFDGVKYPFSAQSLVGGRVTGKSNVCDALLNASVSQPILGLSFLKSVYTVFRPDPPAVGFATLAQARRN
ncbi:hypothetical protein Q8F55_006937 [Vanrija albida]|uniref:Peptidase A1 domain-containing protein n=1 Tax=Vanrija albida TaxID=181172 RepID=A0ABR3PYJ7_9TREE